MRYEWSVDKEQENIDKHGVDFDTACRVFEDKNRIIITDEKHSIDEARWIAIGEVGGEVLTVRFTLRKEVIRIFGAGYWRKERKLYEQENSL
jgi:uncharacterized DUF497 family protein